MAAPASDWRSQINRRKAVDFIFKTLTESFPQGQGREPREIKKIAEEFEAKTYDLAKDTDDYCRRVCSKLEEIQRSTDANNSTNPTIAIQTSINPGGGAVTHSSSGERAVANVNAFATKQNLIKQEQQQVVIPSAPAMVLKALPNSQQPNLQISPCFHSAPAMVHPTSHASHLPNRPVPIPQSLRYSEQQQRLHVPYSGVPNMHPNQHPLRLLQLAEAEAQQQAQLRFSQARKQHAQQLLSKQHLMSQTQSQPSQLQQHLAMQQNSLQRDMQQGLQDPGKLLPLTTVEQEKQLVQSQTTQSEVPSSMVMDSKVQTGDGGVGMCQKIYQRIKSMKDMYLSEMQELNQEMKAKLEVLSRSPNLSDQLQKYNNFKNVSDVLDEILHMLHIPRDRIHPDMSEKLPQYENTLLRFVHLQRARKSEGPRMNQQFEQVGAHTHLMPEHQPSQTSLVQNDSHVNHRENMDLQGSKSVMNSGSAANMQLTSMFPSTHLNIPIKPQNISTIHPFQSPMDTLQPNSSLKQPGSVVLEHQINHEQNEQEHYLMQSQQMKQQQQQQLQQNHNKQLMQPLHQRQKQQQTLQSHQIQQLNRTDILNEFTMRHVKSDSLHEMDDGKELKMKQSSRIKSDFLPSDYSETQCVSFLQQQRKAVTPQNNQTSSPQMSQTTSSHIYQTSMLSSHSPKSEKQNGSSLVPDETNDAHQQTILSPDQSQCLTSGTPGICVSPMQEKFTAPDSSEANEPTALPGISSVTKGPMAALIKAVRSISSTSFRSAMNDIASVVSMSDSLPDYAAADNSIAAVDKDSVATMKLRLQARKRYANSMCLNMSTAVSCLKRRKIEVSHSLLEEITEIEEKLIEVVVKIIAEGDSKIGSTDELGEGVVVEFSFAAVAFGRNWATQSGSSQSPLIFLLRVFVPSKYPESYPKVLDVQPVGQSKEFDDLSVNAHSNFVTSLECLSHPMSVVEMVRVWVSCVRKVVTDYARMNGGGSFSSTYGSWERCVD